MKLLLDTCSFLWLITDDPLLSARARELVRDPVNDVYLSPVSTWEIAVKQRLGGLVLPRPADRFLIEMREAHGVGRLDLTEEATLQVSKLPDLHRDPFDRMLICQAITHGLVILTPDEHIRAYPIRTEW